MFIFSVYDGATRMLLKAFFTASSGLDDPVVDGAVLFAGSFRDTVEFETLVPDGDVLPRPI
jgi:hypothetical protein